MIDFVEIRQKTVGCPFWVQSLYSRVSCQKGPTRHAYAWQIGPFWQDTLELCITDVSIVVYAIMYHVTEPLKYKTGHTCHHCDSVQMLNKTCSLHVQCMAMKTSCLILKGGLIFTNVWVEISDGVNCFCVWICMIIWFDEIDIFTKTLCTILGTVLDINNISMG